MKKRDVVAVVLSAGQSSRMGRDKALLEIHGRSVIQNILSKISESSDSIYVVLGDNYDAVVSNIEEMEFTAQVNCVLNENHHFGMFSSIQKGLASGERGHPVLLQMVDQPFIPVYVYRELIMTYGEGCHVYQPSFGGKAGHPLLLSGEFVENVLSYKATSNLKEIITELQGERKFLEVDDSSVLQNINTPGEFGKAVKDIENGNIYS